MPNTAAQRLKLRENCSLVIPGFATLSPAAEFRAMADWCEAHPVEHDVYGEGALIEDFEKKIATLLGKPAAAFMPSGVMAQNIAVLLWAERRGLPRFGMHPTCHLDLHEEQAYAALLKLHGVPVGNRLRPMVAGDLAAVRQTLACLIVELPIRERGGQLPTWDELLALQTAARERGIALHMDGARLWESRAFYGRSHAEIAAGFDSVYVSVYKGVGGLAGALLVGEDDFIADARLWRRRMGGTLVHQSPMIVSAAMRFDARLAMMDALFARALTLAKGLNTVPGIRVNPGAPHTPMMHLYFDAPADAVAEARDAIAEQDGVWLIGSASPSEVPGWSRTELNVGDTLLQYDNAHVLPLFERLLRDAAKATAPTQAPRITSPAP